MRLAFVSLALAALMASAAEDEPVKLTEIKLKNGNTVRALKFSTLSANGQRSYTLTTVENKRMGLTDADVASVKDITVPFAELPEPARIEIAKQRAATAAAKAPAAKAEPAPTGKAGAAANGFLPAFQTRAERGTQAGKNESVPRALKWLAENQEADGRWASTKNAAQYQQDTAVTGLVLMAFLAAGHGEKFGPYRENVRKGLAWLKSKQSADGLVYDTTDDSAIHRAVGYPHAIAMTALCEAVGMAGGPDTKMAAQKAVDYAVLKQQHKDGGWRYRPGNEGCLSVTGWYLGGLKAAKAAGLRVPPDSINRAATFLETLGHKVEGGGPQPRIFWYMPANEHAQTAHRLTMMGHTSLANIDRPDPGIEASVNWAAQKGSLPQGGANGERTDLYYWYYGSLAAFYAGGDVDEKWRTAVSSTLTQAQAADGPESGSFHPVGDYSGEWGRAGQTALAILCLEAPYRYPKK